MAAPTGSRATTFNDIVASIRKKQYAPIYLLCGEEPYYIDEIADLLQSIVVPEDARDFDLTVMYGADSNIETLANSARRFPMFSDYQLVMLKEAQAMSDVKNQLEKLESYALHPVSTTVLVITFKDGTLKSGSKFVKNIIKSGGVVFESKKVKEWQLDSIIKNYCKTRKIGIDDKSADILKNYIGTDLQRLFNEIDKLIVAGGGVAITPELIETNIGISKDFNNFELIKAISLRQYSKANQIAEYFRKNPKQNPAIVTTSLIFNFFSNLLISYFSKDRSERALQTLLRFKSPYQLTDIMTALPRYNARATLSIIHSIREIDGKLKGINSTQGEYDLLKELIYKIFTA